MEGGGAVGFLVSVCEVTARGCGKGKEVRPPAVIE